MLNSKKPWHKKVNTKTNDNNDDDDDDIDDDYENQKPSRRSIKDFKPLSQSDTTTNSNSSKSLGTGTYRSKLNNINTNTNENENDNESITLTNRRQRSCSACNYIFAIISMMFVTIFFYCSFSYYNNSGPKWLIFTYSHAFIGLLSITARIFCCGYCERSIVVYIAWTGLFWSFVYIILSTIDYKQSLVEQGQAASFNIYYTNVVQDNDSAALDMCLSLFGTLNCCYHITLYYCFPISSSSTTTKSATATTSSTTTSRK